MSAAKKIKQDSEEIQFDVLSRDDGYITVIDAKRDVGFEFLKTWIPANRSILNDHLIHHGGVLFKGFHLTADEFRAATDLISPAPGLKYTGGLSPRSEFQDGIFLATTLPNKGSILLHHEMSYLPAWPKKIFFHCDIPAKSGGETPLCSTRRFMKKLDPKIFKRFADEGVIYVRNYGNLEGYPDGFRWQDSFQTQDKRAVEKFCRENNIQFEWAAEDGLITRYHGQGVARHSVTGEILWHNHAHMYAHFTETPPRPSPLMRAMAPLYTKEVYEKLLRAPLNKVMMYSLYGSGEQIEASVVDEINGLLETEQVTFRWEKGDFVVLDNMLSFHGRNPFEGERRTLAILKEEQRREA